MDGDPGVSGLCLGWPLLCRDRILHHCGSDSGVFALLFAANYANVFLLEVIEDGAETFALRQTILDGRQEQGLRLLRNNAT